MHKYRAAAKQAAWYSEENDPPNYNPFRKARSYEHELRTLHRAQPLHASTAPSETLNDEEVHEDGAAMLSDTPEMVPLNSPPAESPKKARTRWCRGGPVKISEPHDEEQGLPIPHRAFASWKSWSQQKLSQVWRQIVLASGSRRSGDAKGAVADMGMAVIRHAPLGTKGAPLFQVPGRTRRFMVVEYARQDGGITNNTQESEDIVQNSKRWALRAITGGRTGVPLLRFYEKRSPRDDDKHVLDDHQTKSDAESLCPDLLEHLSSVSKPFLSQRSSRGLTNRSEHFPQAHQI